MSSINWNRDTQQFEYGGRNAGWTPEIKQKYKTEKNPDNPSFAICHRISFKTIATGIINSLNYYYYYIRQEEAEPEKIIAFSQSFLAGVILSVKCIPIENGEHLAQLIEEKETLASITNKAEREAKEAAIDQNEQAFVSALLDFARRDPQYRNILDEIKDQMYRSTDFLENYKSIYQNTLNQNWPLDCISTSNAIYLIQNLMQYEEWNEFVRNFYNPCITSDNLLNFSTHISLLKNTLNQHMRKCLQQQNTLVKEQYTSLYKQWTKKNPSLDVFADSYQKSVSLQQIEQNLTFCTNAVKLINIIQNAGGDLDVKKHLLSVLCNFSNLSDQISAIEHVNFQWNACMSSIAAQANLLLERLNCEPCNLKLGNAHWNNSLQDAFDCEFSVMNLDESKSKLYLTSKSDSIQLTNLMHLTLGEHQPESNPEPITATALYMLAASATTGDGKTLPFVYSSNIPLDWDKFVISNLTDCEILYHDYIVKSYQPINYIPEELPVDE